MLYSRSGALPGYEIGVVEPSNQVLFASCGMPGESAERPINSQMAFAARHAHLAGRGAIVITSP